MDEHHEGWVSGIKGLVKTSFSTPDFSSSNREFWAQAIKVWRARLIILGSFWLIATFVILALVAILEVIR